MPPKELIQQYQEKRASLNADIDRILAQITEILGIDITTEEEQRMTAQQLKNSILQMAVQGKLVPQDPNDEPASVLLERIRAEKERLIKEKKIKREKNPSVIFKGTDNTPYEKIGDEVRSLADEVPFDIPDSWEWVRLIDVCEYIQRGKSPKYSPIKKYPVVAQKCNQWSGFSIEKAQFIEPDSLSSYGPERLLQDNDLMWNSTGLGTSGTNGYLQNRS